MIIPVRCFTCGKVLADKWRSYQQKCQEYENPAEEHAEEDRSTKAQTQKDNPRVKQSKSKNFEPAYRGGILDDLGITKICCRRHMLGHVDCIDWI